MSRTLGVAFSTVMTLAFAVVVASEDATREKLAKAKAAHLAEVEKARTVVLDRYKEVLKSFTDSGQLDESLRLRDEMKSFEAAGILHGRAELKKTFLDYGHALKTTKEELNKAYEEAVKDYTKAAELDKADELRTELIELALPARLVSIHLTNRRTLYIQHGDYLAWLRRNGGDRERLNATFELVPGLATRDAVSLRSANVPNHYLAHGNSRLSLARDDDTDVFRQNATFKQLKGLASPSAFSFESINYPGHFIRARGQELWIDKDDKSPQFRADATFSIGDPQFKLW